MIQAAFPPKYGVRVSPALRLQRASKQLWAALQWERRLRPRAAAAGVGGAPRPRAPAIRGDPSRLSAQARCARFARAAPPARSEANYPLHRCSPKPHAGAAGGRGGPRCRAVAIGSHLLCLSPYVRCACCARAAPPARLEAPRGHASEAGRACLSGRRRCPRAVRVRATSHSDLMTISGS